MIGSRMGFIVSVSALTLLFSLVAPSATHAQGFVSGSIGYDFSGDSGCPEITGCDDKHVNWGISAGALGPIFGGELEFTYLPNFFGDIPLVSNSVLTLMGNVMLAPRFGPVQPYGTAGLGLIKTHAELDLAEITETDNNHFGWNAGGGLFIFFGDHFGIRGDIRYYHSFQKAEILGFDFGEEISLDYGRASAGAVFRF